MFFFCRELKELGLPLAFAFYQADSDGYFKSSSECEKIFENMNDPTINAVSLSFKTMKFIDEIQNSVLPTFIDNLFAQSHVNKFLRSSFIFLRSNCSEEQLNYW